MHHLIQCPNNGTFICINLLLKESLVLCHINKYTDVRMEKILSEIEHSFHMNSKHSLALGKCEFVDINFFYSKFEETYDTEMKKCKNDNERNEINNIFLEFVLKMGGSKTINFNQFVDKMKKVKFHFETKGLF